MTRHLNNLKRLAVKLQLRFGDDDALLQLVKRELDAHPPLTLQEPTQQDWSISYRKHLKNIRGATALH